MMPQFNTFHNLKINYNHLVTGILIFSIGLFKKVVIADSLGLYAEEGFDQTIVLTVYDAWLSSLAFTFQIYYDFSGYTDMAIGLALFFNIKLPQNFNSPYKALNIQDFWRRWHMTLSGFFRDYIYIPLGGNKKGDILMYQNMFLVFLIGGIWHGAGWGFILWGVLHGVAIIIYQLWKKTNIVLPKVLSWLILFNFLNITWVFFRAQDIDDAIKVIKGMFMMFNVPVMVFSFDDLDLYYLYALLLGSLLSILWFKNSNEMIDNALESRWTYPLSVILLIISFLHLAEEKTFIYFNF